MRESVCVCVCVCFIVSVALPREEQHGLATINTTTRRQHETAAALLGSTTHPMQCANRVVTQNRAVKHRIRLATLKDERYRGYLP